MSIEQKPKDYMEALNRILNAIEGDFLLDDLENPGVDDRLTALDKISRAINGFMASYENYVEPINIDEDENGRLEMTFQEIAAYIDRGQQVWISRSAGIKSLKLLITGYERISSIYEDGKYYYYLLSREMNSDVWYGTDSIDGYPIYSYEPDAPEEPV